VFIFCQECYFDLIVISVRVCFHNPFKQFFKTYSVSLRFFRWDTQVDSKALASLNFGFGGTWTASSLSEKFLLVRRYCCSWIHLVHYHDGEILKSLILLASTWAKITIADCWANVTVYFQERSLHRQRQMPEHIHYTILLSGETVSEISYTHEVYKLRISNPYYALLSMVW